MSFEDDVTEGFARQSNVDASIIATFVQRDGVQAVVDVGTARVTVPTLGQYFPVPGDPVRLLRVDKQLFLLGPAAPKSPIGRVSATGSPRCTVEYPSGSGVTKLMGYPSNITPAVNDVVLIDWTSGGTVIDKITAAPDVVTPSNPGGSAGPVAKSQVFYANDSGSWNGSRWFTPDVYASDSNLGAWFYGTKIADTIEDTAVITAASIYLPLKSQSGAAPILGVHASPSKAGAPGFGSTSALATRGGWVPVPTAWLDALKITPGGLGFNHGGFSIWHGVQADALSGALAVNWTA